MEDASIIYAERKPHYINANIVEAIFAKNILNQR
jgi:hypothetical protein